MIFSFGLESNIKMLSNWSSAQEHGSTALSSTFCQPNEMLLMRTSHFSSRRKGAPKPLSVCSTKMAEYNPLGCGERKKKKKNFFFKSFSFAQLKQENTIFKLNDIGEVFALWFSFIKITIKRDFWEKMDFLILFYLQLLWVWGFFWTRDLLNHWPLSLKVAIQSVCAVH